MGTADGGGAKVGKAVGDADGELVGGRDGLEDGPAVGATVGACPANEVCRSANELIDPNLQVLQQHIDP